MTTLFFNPRKLISDLIDAHGEDQDVAEEIARCAEEALEALCEENEWTLRNYDGSRTVEVDAMCENEGEVLEVAQRVIQRAIENV
ncbi:hypothetical protein [Methylobacterium nodulans]|uniref:Uncharacterized protein n=1 Tax=Methylobacterium nodulans (strain LMG 21967 / CNCM I-2342 / ORS 2060) TaxID=460265 RepID=B8IQP5_METNO|nr:hypothetical protein [Methylobacterium nodulans]ACL62340.1 hypothetical protein Mnod_7604 [Methylobacterium nodulans ORS 2060]